MARTSSGNLTREGLCYAMAGLLTRGASVVGADGVHSFPDHSSGFHARFTLLTVAGQLPILTAFPFSSPDGEPWRLSKNDQQKLQPFPAIRKR
jgi:hypothetical protein